MFEYLAEGVRAVDGDTIDCIIDLGFDIKIKKRVRLKGIDTPECRTKDLVEKAKGLSAKERVVNLIEGKHFIIRTEYDRVGKYGRVIGEIELVGGIILNDLLVSEGHAKRVDYK
ncbi:TPA: thermonuclease family protein [Candidatus Woesearchaeota archaeon]|jgi:micrococcal nuclease|nr:thermonuclease family protein [Candidatus Woesearchaeota archaeon]